MRSFKLAVLGAGLATAFAVAASAAEPTPTTQPTPPQVAANPGLPYSPTRIPGPKAGPSSWIPSPYAPAAPNSGTEIEGSYYSSKGFGPKPH